jgi:hypothetical protein
MSACHSRAAFANDISNLIVLRVLSRPYCEADQEHQTLIIQPVIQPVLLIDAA